ncbi:hypothetical protein [Actomonas aquatica]|uniref:Uncharacterized protein n=1 Tax=Actomonas aquatica TaxID=2866162 RepID=A0ABZ1CAT2_9BACT|nr:hypothetical protein [Opitutus sp. WL0086]WRQ88417.1 hypothetical protein K1X11_003310 [Opitutus sp. WL0086]
MSQKFSAKELERARQIANAVRNTRSDMELIEGAGGGPSIITVTILLIVGIAAVAGASWWWLSKPDPANHLVFTPPQAEVAQPPLAPPSRQPTNQSSTKKVTAPSPRSTAKKEFNPYVTRTLPTKPQPKARPASGSYQSSVSLESHRQSAADYAESFFLHDYVLGSAEKVVRNVTVFPRQTERMVGWSQIRSTGNVEIEYYNRNTRAYGTTRRGYEAITTESDGDLRVVEFAPKTAEYK